jgi:quercetin dioxygenase-like cupin family protein
MNALSKLSACLLLVSTSSFATDTGAPAVPEGTVVQKAEVMKKKPARDWPGAMRTWEIHNSPGASTRLHEIVGTVPMHAHPDSHERLFLMEGEATLLLGTRTVVLKPGDYIDVPPNVPHKVWVASGKRALLAAIAIPPADPKQVQWIEPAPKAAPK